MPQRPPAATDTGDRIRLTRTGNVRGQAAGAVLMVRPACFGWNSQTESSNAFQREVAEITASAAVSARAEFDELVVTLRNAAVTVHVAEDRAVPLCPDAVFPNNWVSLHADGTAVMYPMLAPNRRLERRGELLTGLVAQGHRLERVLDLTSHETAGRYLEGTGSVVFDHLARTAYACLSPRTDRTVLDVLCAELGYDACVFHAYDAAGAPVYHTNVVLAVGTDFAVLARDMIYVHERDVVMNRLAQTGRDVIAIDAAQVAQFAGNVLEVRAADGAAVLVLSEQALAAFPESDRNRLQRGVDRIVSAPIPVIETLGGGSVRCMLAEVFLPH